MSVEGIAAGPRGQMSSWARATVGEARGWKKAKQAEARDWMQQQGQEAADYVREQKAVVRSYLQDYEEALDDGELSEDETAEFTARARDWLTTTSHTAHTWVQDNAQVAVDWVADTVGQARAIGRSISTDLQGYADQRPVGASVFGGNSQSPAASQAGVWASGSLRRARSWTDNYLEVAQGWAHQQAEDALAHAGGAAGQVQGFADQVFGAFEDGELGFDEADELAHTANDWVNHTGGGLSGWRRARQQEVRDWTQDRSVEAGNYMVEQMANAAAWRALHTVDALI